MYKIFQKNKIFFFLFLISNFFVASSAGAAVGGEQVWEEFNDQFGNGTAGIGLEAFVDMAVSDDGIYMVGTAQSGSSEAGIPKRWLMQKRNLDGGVEWTDTILAGGGEIEAFASAVEVGSDGMYVAGQFARPFFGLGGRIKIQKRTFGGSVIWDKTVDSSSIILATTMSLAIDNTGLYFYGLWGSSFVVHKRDFDGNVLWTQNVGNSYGRYSNLVVDPSGLYVARNTDPDPYSFSDHSFVLEKRDLSDGQIIWDDTKSLQIGGKLAVDSSALYVVDTTGFEKRDLTNGNVITSNTLALNAVGGMAVGNNSLYVNGTKGSPYIIYPAYSDGLLTIGSAYPTQVMVKQKYDLDGNLLWEEETFGVSPYNTFIGRDVEYWDDHVYFTGTYSYMHNDSWVISTPGIITIQKRTPGSVDYDCGLRAYDGAQVLTVACEELGTLTSPLRLRAGDGNDYGIILVDPSETVATPLIINTPSGLKAIKENQN